MLHPTVKEISIQRESEFETVNLDSNAMEMRCTRKFRRKMIMMD